MNILKMTAKFQSFVSKLQLWQLQLKSNVLNAFPSIQSLLPELTATPDLGPMIDHLCSLERRFGSYFPEIAADEQDRLQLIQNPFDFDPLKAPAEFAEGIIDLQHDVESRNLFSNHSLATFWIRSRPISPICSKKHYRSLLLFHRHTYVKVDSVLLLH